MPLISFDRANHPFTVRSGGGIARWVEIVLSAASRSPARNCTHMTPARIPAFSCSWPSTASMAASTRGTSSAASRIRSSLVDIERIWPAMPAAADNVSPVLAASSATSANNRSASGSNPPTCQFVRAAASRGAVRMSFPNGSSTGRRSAASYARFPARPRGQHILCLQPIRGAHVPAVRRVVSGRVQMGSDQRGVLVDGIGVVDPIAWASRGGCRNASRSAAIRRRPGGPTGDESVSRAEQTRSGRSARHDHLDQLADLHLRCNTCNTS